MVVVVTVPSVWVSTTSREPSGFRVVSVTVPVEGLVVVVVVEPSGLRSVVVLEEPEPPEEPELPESSSSPLSAR